MVRKNILLSDNAAQTLQRMMKDKNMSASRYISQLIIDDSEQKKESIDEVRDYILMLKRAESANGKNISAIMEMLNTFFKTFAGDEINSNQFYAIGEDTHPWVKKSLDEAENKIRMAKYRKHK